MTSGGAPDGGGPLTQTISWSFTNARPDPAASSSQLKCATTAASRRARSRRGAQDESDVTSKESEKNPSYQALRFEQLHLWPASPCWQSCCWLCPLSEHPGSLSEVCALWFSAAERPEAWTVSANTEASSTFAHREQRVQSSMQAIISHPAAPGLSGAPRPGFWACPVPSASPRVRRACPGPPPPQDRIKFKLLSVSFIHSCSSVWNWTQRQQQRDICERSQGWFPVAPPPLRGGSHQKNGEQTRTTRVPEIQRSGNTSVSHSTAELS